MSTRQRAGGAAPAVEQGQRPPPLLRLLEQLGNAAWSAALLPLLQQDGSLASLALACKQVRALVQKFQEELQLSEPPGSGLASAAALVPERFPACHTVAVSLVSTDDAIRHWPDVLPALARLPSLSRLELDASVQGPNLGVSVAAALGMARLALQRLRSLQLSSACAKGGHVMHALRGITQPTWLKLELKTAPLQGLDLRQLVALSSLVQLERLDVTAEHIDLEPASCAYLPCLTRLSHLHVPLRGMDGLAAGLAGLTRLRCLHAKVNLADGEEPSLDEAACAALGQLLSLTCWSMRGCDGTSSPAFLGAVAGLQQLRVLIVDDCSPATLGVVAGMPRLTQLVSDWRPPADGDDVQLAVCSRVDALNMGVAHVPLSLERSLLPWASFPGLVSSLQHDAWSPREFESLAASCKQLSALYFGKSGSRSLCECPRAQQISAMRGLAQLSQLRYLEWSAADDCELGLLATLTQLRTLMVFAPSSSRCTVAGVTRVAGSSHLRSMSLDLQGLLRGDACTEDAAYALLTGCGQLASLTLHVSEQQRVLFEGVLTACRDGGVPVPGVVTFRSFKSGW